MSKYTTTQAIRALPVREPRVFPVHEGKAFLVTGATGGIGRAIVELLLAQGAKVVIADLKPEAIEQTASDLGGPQTGAFGVAMDVASDEAIVAAVALSAERTGELDGLVNCAAIVLHAHPLAIPRSEWREQFEVNWLAPMRSPPRGSAYDRPRRERRDRLDRLGSGQERP